MKNNSPTVRLAHHPGAQGDCVLMGREGVEQIEKESAPALLVSFVYLKPFLEAKDLYAYRDWALDSGAFSAHNSGMTIDLQEYIETCKELLATDKTLTEVFALDVIGDPKASIKNCEAIWKAGVPAIPCYHHREPEDFLKHIAKNYPKIALGGAVGLKPSVKMEWARACFARVWPKRIHGFGFGSEDAIMSFPWHSTDATNWELGPCGFGNWKSYGKMSVRGSSQNLRSEIEWYLRLEARARRRWSKEMEKLEASGIRKKVIRGLSAVERERERSDSTLHREHQRECLPGQIREGVRSRERERAGAIRLSMDAGSASGKRCKTALAPTIRLSRQGNVRMRGTP